MFLTDYGQNQIKVLKRGHSKKLKLNQESLIYGFVNYQAIINLKKGFKIYQ